MRQDPRQLPSALRTFLVPAFERHLEKRFIHALDYDDQITRAIVLANTSREIEVIGGVESLDISYKTDNRPLSFGAEDLESSDTSMPSESPQL